MAPSGAQYSQNSIVYLRRTILRWGQSHQANFPWRTDCSRFHALIAEILLQRTRAEQVAEVYDQFRARFPTAAELAHASLYDIEKSISSLGLSWRAKSLSALGRRLTELNEAIPVGRKELLDLPGVGPYVASAFLSLHMGVRACIVDSNTIRVYGRYFGFATHPETRRAQFVWQLSDRITPIRVYRRFNYALLDFSRTVCKPTPRHEHCPLVDRCAEISS